MHRIIGVDYNGKKYKRRRYYEPPVLCGVEECDRESRARGLCSKHYSRWRVNGTTDIQGVCRICKIKFIGGRNEQYCSDKCRKERNKIKIKLANKEGYASRQRFLRAVKWTAGCADCGYDSNVHALQFDHIGPKNFKVAAGNSFKMIVSELEKCEVRCANCHSIQTWERSCTE
jgi:hypothetical protein